MAIGKRSGLNLADPSGPFSFKGLNGKGPRIAIGTFLSLIATQALADPCRAIPDKGPAPAWARAGFVVTGTARHIIDGDGLCIGSSRDAALWVEVRLADFYAPELREVGGAEAKAALTRLTGRQTITCTAVRGDGGRVVSYDRLIAVCRIGKVSLADLMRRDGQDEGGRGLRGR